MTQDDDTRFHKELNFRDLGGYPTKDGGMIKKGIFYRSGGLYLMNEQERHTFESLGIHSILDLRTEQESTVHPDPVLDGIHMIRHSGVVSKGGEEIDFSPKGMNQIGEAGEKQLRDLKEYYCEMPFHNEAFQMLVKEIRNGDVPICFHCATGKDRTGVAAMIVLFLMDVDEEVVYQDYMESNEYRKVPLSKSLKGNAERIKASPVLGELLQMKDGVSGEIGHAVIHEMKQRYGSYDAYFLKEFGIDEQERKRLRDQYTVQGTEK